MLINSQQIKSLEHFYFKIPFLNENIIAYKKFYIKNPYKYEVKNFRKFHWSNKNISIISMSEFENFISKISCFAEKFKSIYGNLYRWGEPLSFG